MIKIVFAFDCLVVLFFVEDFVERVHGEEGDPRHAQLLDDRVGHGRLAARASAADADQERLHELALSIVPENRNEDWNNFSPIVFRLTISEPKKKFFFHLK